MKPSCIAVINPNGKMEYQTSQTPIIPPEGDGVYKADGSPQIGTYSWINKIPDKDGFRHVTWSGTMPVNGELVDIPNSHNILVCINTAFTTIEMDTMLKFDHVPYTNPDGVDISISFNNGTDPVFVNTPSAMAYTYFPGTKPAGQFCSVYNLKFTYSLDGKYNFSYDLNETLRHELRHGIGLVHTTNPNDLMYPFYSERRIPSTMDIYQEQFIYGVRNPPVNPVEKSAFYDADSRLVEFS